MSAKKIINKMKANLPKEEKQLGVKGQVFQLMPNSNI